MVSSGSFDSSILQDVVSIHTHTEKDPLPPSQKTLELAKAIGKIKKILQ